MEFLNSIKERMPEYAKDIRLNLDGAIARSSLAPEDALGVALAAAVAARSPELVAAFKAAIPGAEGHAALTAAALMGTLPIAVGIGAGAESRQPLGLAVVGGLAFSQLVTLYVTPVVYTYLDALRKKKRVVEQRVGQINSGLGLDGLTAGGG